MFILIEGRGLDGIGVMDTLVDQLFLYAGGKNILHVNALHLILVIHTYFF